VCVTSLAFSPDGKTLLSGGVGNVVIPGFFINAQHADQACLWDVKTGKQIRQLTQRGNLVAFAPDGKTMAVGGVVVVGERVGNGGGVSINGGTRVDLGTGQPGQPWMEIVNQGGGFVFSADGKMLATTWGSRQHLGRSLFENKIKHRTLALWELATGREIMVINQEQGTPIVALSPDGKKVAAGRLYVASFSTTSSRPGGTRKAMPG